MEEIPFGTFCSGIGAPEVASEGLGFRAVFNSEIEAFPSSVLARHWPNVPNLGDFTKIDRDWLDQICVLIAGTPCQAFSVAGLRNSLSDERGNLTIEFVKKVHAAKSLFCALWENVPGVLSTDDNAFGCFLGALVGADDAVLPCDRPQRGKSNAAWRWRDAGKYPVLDEEGNETGEFAEKPEGHIAKWPSVGMVAGPLGRAAWRVFNAQYFGVPQRRRRVFLIFSPIASGCDPAAILFEPKGMQGDFAESEQQGKDVAGTLSARSQGGGGLGTDFEIGGGLQVTGTLSSGAHPGGYNGQDAYKGLLQPVAFGGGNTSGPLDVTATLTATLTAKGNRQDFEVETFIAEPIPFDCKASGQNGFGTGDVFPTLRAMGHAHSHQNGGGHQAVAFALGGRKDGAQVEISGDQVSALRASAGGSSRDYIANYGVRRLLPVECERLQGFPDGHTDVPKGNKPAADGPRYKACGNSMAVPNIRWILKRIADEYHKYV